MTTTRCATLTTTMRVVDRVHNNPTDVWTLAKPTVTASLANFDVLLVRIRHGTN
jgi:hypothetical protein